MKRLALVLFLAAASLAPAFADDAPKLSDGALLPYLEQVINWQRLLSDTEITPGSGRESLLKETLQHNTRKTLQNAFDFARAEAAIVTASKTPDEQKADDASPDGNSRHAKIMQRMEVLDKQVDDTNAQIDQVNAALAKAKHNAREPLLIQREHLNGTLKLADAQQDILKTMLGIFKSTGEDVGGLAGKINRLERSMADELGNSQAKPDACVADRQRHGD
jgi:chromosome segregation ATPase